MESVLIVSPTAKSSDFLKEILHEASFNIITSSLTCSEARRMVSERDFDLVIINAPLKDENGEIFSRYVASTGRSQVILIVKAEHFEEISAVTEDDGVFTLAKPINRTVFWSALKLAKSMHNRIRKMHKENNKLKQKIEDIRIIDRAKCVLISYMNMNENDAHKYIEKQAMDMRETKRQIAENILKTYEN